MDIEHKSFQKQRSSKVDNKEIKNRDQLYPSLQKPTQRSNYKLILCPLTSHKPSSIQNLAYSDSLDVLAVARENNLIEIWKPKLWQLRGQIHCEKDCPIQKIGFIDTSTQTLLVVAHTNSTFNFYELDTLKPVISKFVGGNAIWDFSINPKNQILVACDSGDVFLCKLEGIDDFFISKSLRQFAQKALCVDFDNQDPQIGYVGYEGGHIRKFDLKKNDILATMTLPREVIIWSIISTSQSHILAGTNEGNIYIFESKFGTLIQILKTHEADILTFQSNKDHTQIYGAGLDSKIVSLELVQSQNTLNWIISSQDRGQSHDVRSIVIIDNSLVSGGITTDICIHRLVGGKFLSQSQGNIEKKKRRQIQRRHITSLPLPKSIRFIPSKDILIKQTNYSLELWQLQLEKMEFHYLMEIKSKNSPIISFDCDMEAQCLIYSTLDHTFLFNLDIKNLKLVPKSQMESNNQIMQFIRGTNKFLGLTTDLTLYQYDVAKLKSTTLIQLPDKFRAIYQDILVSRDNKIAVIGSKLRNNIILVFLETNKWEEIRQFMGTYHYVCFNFSLENNLIICYENHKILEYDLSDSTATEWIIEDENGDIKEFPLVLGIENHESSYDKFIVISNYLIFQINLKEMRCDKEGQYHKIKVFTMKLIYKNMPIISCEKYDERTLLGITYDWKSFANCLPEAINSRKYGL